jgi:hypothetical protein
MHTLGFIHVTYTCTYMYKCSVLYAYDRVCPCMTVGKLPHAPVYICIHVAASSCFLICQLPCVHIAVRIEYAHMHVQKRTSPQLQCMENSWHLKGYGTCTNRYLVKQYTELKMYVEYGDIAYNVQLSKTSWSKHQDSIHYPTSSHP